MDKMDELAEKYLDEIAPQEFFDGTGPELGEKLRQAGLWLFKSGCDARDEEVQYLKKACLLETEAHVLTAGKYRRAFEENAKLTEAVKVMREGLGKIRSGLTTEMHKVEFYTKQTAHEYLAEAERILKGESPTNNTHPPQEDESW